MFEKTILPYLFDHENIRNLFGHFLFLASSYVISKHMCVYTHDSLS